MSNTPDILAITANWSEDRTDRELAFALGAVDTNDPNTLRWLACCIARKLDYMAQDAEGFGRDFYGTTQGT